MFKNCNKFIKTLFPSLVLNFVYNPVNYEYYNLTKNEKAFANVITVNNLLDPNFVINKGATKILWSKHYQKVIDDFKQKLKNNTNANNKIILDYVYDNLLEAPFILKNFNPSDPKHQALQKFFNAFLDLLRIKREENNVLIEDKSTQSLNERELRNKNRKELHDAKDLLNSLDSLSLSEDKPTTKLEKIRHSAIKSMKGKAVALDAKPKISKPKVKIPSHYTIARDTKLWKDEEKKKLLEEKNIKKQIHKIMKGADLADLTIRKIRSKVSEKFEIDFDEDYYKKLVKKLVHEVQSELEVTNKEEETQDPMDVDEPSDEPSDEPIEAKIKVEIQKILDEHETVTMKQIRNFLKEKFNVNFEDEPYKKLVKTIVNELV